MSIETLTSTILREMPDINKWQRDFFQHHLGLFLSLRGRYTYLNFERYGGKNELTYRNHHASGFAFRAFNRRLIEKYTGTRRMHAFDPSYIPKSGKHTPGVGYFWSGCASKAKWGLELCGFATVDVDANTALHYFAAQTLPKEGQSLMGFYRALLRQHLITRLRNDAVLHYAPPPKKAGQKGRPKKYGDRFSARNPDSGQLARIAEKEGQRIYAGLVDVKSLQRLVQAALVQELKADGQLKSVRIFICTDLEFSVHDILPYYKSRFQIEFLYRDAKQHTGLENSQSRHTKALEYHFNMSLTAVSVAKVVHHLSIDKSQRGPFSMADIKTQYFNERMIDSIFEVFANFPNLTKNHPALQQLYNLGKIAA